MAGRYNERGEFEIMASYDAKLPNALKYAKDATVRTRGAQLWEQVELPDGSKAKREHK